MPEVRPLKWRTFAVASLGLFFLQVLFAWMDPALPMAVMVLRAVVLIAGALILNEYVFRIVGRSQRSAERQRLELDALLRVTQALAFLPTMERNLGPALETVGAELEADLVGWMESSPNGEETYCPTLVGKRLSALPARFGGGDLVARALELQELTVVEDIAGREGSPGAFLVSEGVRALAVLPVAARGRHLGAVLVGWRAPRHLEGEEMAFLAHVCDLFGVAADNLRLWRENHLLGAIQERERIAREMHDGLAQVLTYLKLRAETVLGSPEVRRRPSRMIEALEETRQAAVDALGDVRQVIMDLRQPTATLRPFTVRLAEYLRDWSAQSGVPSDIELPQGDLRLPDDVELQVLRIVQEALTNVRKHAAAGSARVRVGTRNGMFEVWVSDDGRGFDLRQPLPAGHFGLSILAERAEAIGGQLEVTARPGQGTEVVLRVPEDALGWVRPAGPGAGEAGLLEPVGAGPSS